MNLTRRTYTRTDRFLICGALVGILMLFMMQGMTTYTFDDYYYAVFLRDGPKAFLEKNLEHYCLRNGRVLVHIAVEILLAGGRWFYSVGNLVVLAAVIGIAVQYLDRDAHRDWPLVLGSSVAMVMISSMGVLRSWLLCPADSVNYMLPMVALLGMLLALRRRKRIPALLLSLLCGAATELFAVMGFAAAAAELLWMRYKEGRWDWIRLACLGGILCGLTSILLSPATQERVSAEFSLSGIGFSFLRYANSIAAPGTSLPLLTAAALLLGKSLPRKMRWSAAAVAALLASGWILPRSTVFTAVIFGVFCAYALVSAGMMIRTDDRKQCGFLLLAGLASAAVMTLTDSGSVRVTVPFALCLVLVSTHFIRSCAVEWRWLRTGVSLLLCLAVLTHVPTLQGIAENWKIMVHNEQSFAAGGDTYTDYDPRYATQQLFMSSDYQRVYLAYLGLEHLDVQYTYSYGPDVELGGKQYPSVFYQDRIYIPLRAAVEAAGGTVDMISDGFLEIRLGENVYLYHASVLYTPNGSRDVNWEFIILENNYYISTSVLGDEMGLAVSMMGV